MGYLNEFPHWEASNLNMDWILKQYSTFNQRIKEIQDHFDEVAEQMQEGIDTFEENVNNSLAQMTQDITDLQGDFDSFVETVNQNFSDLTDDIRADVDEAISDIQNQITAISNNMVTYISDHMEEWQAEATINDHILKFSSGDISIVENDVVNQIQADGKKYDVAPRIHSEYYHGTTNFNDQTGAFSNPITLTEGTYILWMTQRLSSESYSDYTYNRVMRFDLLQDSSNIPVSIFDGSGLDSAPATGLSRGGEINTTYNRTYNSEIGSVSPQAQAFFIFTVDVASLNVYPMMTIPLSGSTPYLWINWMKLN